MSACRSCGSGELEAFLSLGDLPLADAIRHPDQLDESEARHPLNVALCAKCSLVQLLEEVPPEELFCRDFPYYSSVSDAFLEHCRRNTEARVAGRGLGPDHLVVELASNDGYLLQYYQQKGIPVLGIDPAEGPAARAEERGIPTLCAFFTRQLAAELVAEGRRADVLHANNVLAHVPDLNGFVAGVAALLREDGLAVIEVPYVRELIDRCAFDTIYHEHHCYFSVTALAALFRRHGLRINDVEPFEVHGGSLRVFASRRDDESERVTEFLNSERIAGLGDAAYYASFAARVAGIQEALRLLLEDLRDRGQRLAAYGAAAKGSVLLNSTGIGPELIDFVADLSPWKQGRYMPGVRVPIVAPEALITERPDYVLLLAWNLAEEVLRQQRAYSEVGGRFIVPIPAPRIL